MKFLHVKLQLVAYCKALSLSGRFDKEAYRYQKLNDNRQTGGSALTMWPSCLTVPGRTVERSSASDQANVHRNTHTRHPTLDISRKLQSHMHTITCLPVAHDKQP